MKLDLRFLLKASIFYCVISIGISLIGLLLPEKSLQINPTSSLSIQEVGGHILWGLVAGIPSLGLRYFLLCGLFALFIDSDHLIALLHIEVMPRMSHSIFFGLISVVSMMLLFGKKDYRLGAIVAAALLSHISYDIFVWHESGFPIFAPFYNNMIELPYVDWVILEVAAISIVGFTVLLKLWKDSHRSEIEHLTK